MKFTEILAGNTTLPSTAKFSFSNDNTFKIGVPTRPALETRIPGKSRDTITMLAFDFSNLDVFSCYV